MSKTKIIDAWFDNKNNISCVIKKSPYGDICGTAYLHEEDLDVANEFTGCAIAEYRCDTKIQQARAKHLRERSNAMKEMWINYMNTPLADNEDFFDVTYFIYQQYQEAEKQANNARKKYLDMKRNDKTFANKLVENKREYRKKMDERLKNKSK